MCAARSASQNSDVPRGQDLKRATRNRTRRSFFEWSLKKEEREKELSAVLTTSHATAADSKTTLCKLFVLRHKSFFACTVDKSNGWESFAEPQTMQSNS